MDKTFTGKFFIRSSGVSLLSRWGTDGQCNIPQLIEKILFLDKRQITSVVAELFYSGTGDLRTDAGDLKKDLRTDVKDLKTKMGLSEIQAEIICAVLENEWITQQKLSEPIGISSRNIRKNMDVLKAKGLLKRIGPQKGGRWKIIPPQKGVQTEGLRWKSKLLFKTRYCCPD